MISVCNESLICNCDSAEILRPQHFVVVCELTSIHDNILFSIKLDLQESQGFDKIAEFFFDWPGQPGQARSFFSDDRPGLAILASILFYRPEQPERPKVGPIVEFGR